METRGIKLFEKFTKNTSENPKYRDWFPKKTSLRETRKVRPYMEEGANTSRLYRSPIYAMRRVLNDQPAIEVDPTDLTGTCNKP